MADRIVKVSDLTGEIIDEEHLARLVVEGYGDLQGGQITLDVRPEEIEEEIPEDGDLVVLSYYPPGAASGRRFFMERTDFEKLSQTGEMAEILEDARRAQKEQEERTRRGRRRTRTTQPGSEKTDYASPEHAGEPHRGRATEREKEYVQA